MNGVGTGRDVYGDGFTIECVGSPDRLEGGGRIAGWICSQATGRLIMEFLQPEPPGCLTSWTPSRCGQPPTARLARRAADAGLVFHDVGCCDWARWWLDAHGDEAAYQAYRDHYRAMATSLGFEGHMKWAEAVR